ncbi:acylneuraminate cytidylyltransferase family protein [Chitinimonas taiwanensis]|uniref:N-acylneuraminate cytidylyltransferase n=1 Tax=Chitinimonas taiwanensis DSM 18899 TaxID=1121279 RepID=A0A1K2HPZ4_9NEIS|nr:acylneuraminate cytidylyltransferase family protein [Chitinimonas taiwanensis]SFZ78880.1 N-acylneuraminate cytidylyltransferase [Chitinimonas taiwanensis DSM 18899]
MKTVATICARGGSVGVPRKNILPVAGRPLIAHSIEQALSLPEIDAVYVSTDCPEIALVAQQYGARVPFLRPSELATSSAAKIPVIQHLCDWIDTHDGPFDRIVDLDPTSPLRLTEDIVACLNLLESDVDAVITAFESEKNPYFNMVERKADGHIGLVCEQQGGVVARQLAPQVYSMNASIYVWHRHTLSKGLWSGSLRLHTMPRERSIDIDSPLDLKIVEMLLAERISVVRD